MTTVTDMEFKSRVSYFIDEPSQEPVYITKHGKRVAALINAVELERLITTLDNRQSYYVKDLPQDAIRANKGGPQFPVRPWLDHLMD